MKKFTYTLLIVAALFTITTAAIEINECDATALKEQLKKLLKHEFKYDSSSTVRVNYSEKEQFKETEVVLFMGEKYRFLFNTSALPEGIKIEIYDRKAESKKERKLLYSIANDEGKLSENTYQFEPKKSKKMYIDYTIPASKAVNQKGCVVFLLGYKL